MRAILLLISIATIIAARVQIQFVNTLPVPVDLYWNSFRDGNDAKVGNIRSHRTVWLESDFGHVFKAKSQDEQPVEISRFTVMEGTSQYYIRLPDSTECQSNPALMRFMDDMNQKVQQEITRHEDERRSNEERRVFLNRVQPTKVPKFTPIGFEKRRIPDSAWTSLKQYYTANRDNEVAENWEPGNTYVNHWEVPPTMIHLDGETRQAVFDAVQPVLEEWIGQELEPTSCYGIRLYHNNSVLRNHVDILETHAVSAILNLDQDVDEEWPLEIFNHNGESVEILMAPGDMVLYESAACIHGREKPMKGRYYANTFVHFRPKHNWNFPPGYI